MVWWFLILITYTKPLQLNSGLHFLFFSFSFGLQALMVQLPSWNQILKIQIPNFMFSQLALLLQKRILKGVLMGNALWMRLPSQIFRRFSKNTVRVGHGFEAINHLSHLWFCLLLSFIVGWQSRWLTVACHVA